MQTTTGISVTQCAFGGRVETGQIVRKSIPATFELLKLLICQLVTKYMVKMYIPNYIVCLFYLLVTRPSWPALPSAASNIAKKLRKQ